MIWLGNNNDNNNNPTYPNGWPKKRPPWSKKTPKKEPPLQQLQTHNLPTDDIKNTIGTTKGGDLLSANKPQAVPWETEMTSQWN